MIKAKSIANFIYLAQMTFLAVFLIAYTLTHLLFVKFNWELNRIIVNLVVLSTVLILAFGIYFLIRIYPIFRKQNVSWLYTLLSFVLLFFSCVLLAFSFITDFTLIETLEETNGYWVKIYIYSISVILRFLPLYLFIRRY
jgi:hypothetical protein